LGASGHGGFLSKVVYNTTNKVGKQAKNEETLFFVVHPTKKGTTFSKVAQATTGVGLILVVVYFKYFAGSFLRVLASI
jgi:hypothetical protein